MKINGTDSRSKRHRRRFAALALIAACAMTVAGAQGSDNGKSARPATLSLPAKVINIRSGVAWEPFVTTWRLCGEHMETCSNIARLTNRERQSASGSLIRSDACS